MRLRGVMRVLWSLFVFGVWGSTLVRAEGASPSLLAVFEIKRGRGANERFELLRTDSRIEHRFNGGEWIEVWLRDERGEISHLKVFPKARRVVHYTAGDLRTLHIAPNWEELGSLISPSDRRSLTQVGTAQMLGQRANRLKGSLANAPASLTWLVQDGLPARLSVGNRSTRREVQLVAHKACSPDVCAGTNTADYRELEFADLGDAEQDPFVKRFVAATGPGHRH